MSKYIKYFKFDLFQSSDIEVCTLFVIIGKTKQPYFKSNKEKKRDKVYDYFKLNKNLKLNNML